MNRVDLEGTLVQSSGLAETDGKRVINFLIENKRKTKNGITKFKYNCVAWGGTAEFVEDELLPGAFVRITGHLQDNTLELPDGKIFHYSKTCVDFIETANYATAL